MYTYVFVKEIKLKIMFYKKFKILTVASSAFLLRGAKTRRNKFQVHEVKQGFFS